MGTIQHSLAMIRLLTFSSLLALGLCLHDSVIENVSDFSDFQVFRATPKTREEADFLHSLRLTATHYDFWTEVRVGGAVDIMVPQEKKEELLADLEDRNIQHSLHINNVQELIEKEKIPAAPERWQMTRMAPRHAMTWTEYHPLEDMYTYLDYLEAEFDFVTTEEIVEASQQCGSTVVSTRGSGFPLPPPPGCSRSWWRTTRPTPTSLRTWTGSSSPLQTPMATTGRGTTTGCGGRQDPATGAFWVARVWMQTATGDSTGTRAAPPTTGAPTLTTDHLHSLRLKMSMSVTSLLPGRTSLFSTTRFIATASSSFFLGDSRMKLPTTTTTCMPWL